MIAQKEPAVEVFETTNPMQARPGDHVTWTPTQDFAPERDDWYRTRPGFTLTIRRPIVSEEESK